jgi:hypothetical protein
MSRIDPPRAAGAVLLPAMVLAVTVLSASPAFAQDRADLDRTQIIGNRELPKVLYIVPWKKPLPGDLAGRPIDSVLDEALAPVDRDVFRRAVRYDALAKSPADPAAAAPGAAAAVPAPAATAAPAR